MQENGSISSTLITQSVGTLYLLTILLLKIEIIHSTPVVVSNITVCMANSVDPDQMPHFAASDLDLHCLQSLYVPILGVITVMLPNMKNKCGFT